MRCYDDGALRAYLDDSLRDAEHAGIVAHLAGCGACRDRLEEQRALAAHVGELLVAPAAAPDPRLALARFWATTNHQSEPTQYATRNMQHPPRRTIMRTSTPFWAGPRRGLFAGLAAIVALVALLALPPVRAAADQLLQVFRVQKVLFVPINSDRLEQLKNLNFDAKTLFVARPKLVNQPAPTRAVGSADAAAAAVGFSISEPTVFPSAPASTETLIHDRSVTQFQVNVESARQLLTLMGIDDVALPDSLGAKPIVADAPPFVETRYHGANYTLTLYQGHSPSVTLPDGVELAQLGKAALRLLGTDPDQAEAMSRQIDWNSTLIFPFPGNIRDIRQVQIGDTQGLLVGADRDRHWQLYWQHGDRFSMLEGQGNINETDMIAAAESVH